MNTSIVGKPTDLLYPTNEEEACLYLRQFCFQLSLPRELGRGHQTVIEYEILHLQMIGNWYAHHYLKNRDAELLQELESERGVGIEPMAHAAFALLEVCKLCVQYSCFHHSHQSVSVSYQNFYHLWICLLADDIQSELKRGFRNKGEITSLRKELDQGRDFLKELENLEIGKKKQFNITERESLGLTESSTLGALIKSIAVIRDEPSSYSVWRAWNYYVKKLRNVTTRQSEPDNGPTFYVDEQGKLWLRGVGNQAYLYPELEAQKIATRIAAQTDFWKRHPVRIIQS